MYTKEFGKIETVWENVPVGGLLIRQENGGILLEERLDTEGNFDVVHLFGEGKTLSRKEDLCYVLCTARKYRSDLSEPIFAKVVRSAKDKEDENADKARRDYFASAVEKSANHHWDCVGKEPKQERFLILRNPKTEKSGSTRAGIFWF